jgi:hypothetical protein
MYILNRYTFTRAMTIGTFRVVCLISATMERESCGRRINEADTVMAGAASLNGGHIFPVVALRGGGVRRSIRVTLGAVPDVLGVDNGAVVGACHGITAACHNTGQVLPLVDLVGHYL